MTVAGIGAVGTWWSGRMVWLDRFHLLSDYCNTEFFFQGGPSSFEARESVHHDDEEGKPLSLVELQITQKKRKQNNLESESNSTSNSSFQPFNIHTSEVHRHVAQVNC